MTASVRLPNRPRDPDPDTPRWARPTLGARRLAAVCCLLAALPALGVVAAAPAHARDITTNVPLNSANLWTACQQKAQGVKADRSLFGAVPSTCEYVPTVDLARVTKGQPYDPMPFDPEVFPTVQDAQTPIVTPKHEWVPGSAPLVSQKNCGSGTGSVGYTKEHGTATTVTNSFGLLLFGPRDFAFSWGISKAQETRKSESVNVTGAVPPWQVGEISVSESRVIGPAMLHVVFPVKVNGHWNWYGRDPSTRQPYRASWPSPPPGGSVNDRLWNRYHVTSRPMLPSELASCGNSAQVFHGQLYNKWATQYSNPQASWCLTYRGHTTTVEACDPYSNSPTNHAQRFYFIPLAWGVTKNYLIGRSQDNQCLTATPLNYMWRPCDPQHPAHGRDQIFNLAPVSDELAIPTVIPALFELVNLGTGGCANNWSYGASNPGPTSPGKYGVNHAWCQDVDDRMTWTMQPGKLTFCANLTRCTLPSPAPGARSPTLMVGRTPDAVTVSGNSFPAAPVVKALDANNNVLARLAVPRLEPGNGHFDVVWKRGALQGIPTPGLSANLPAGTTAFLVESINVRQLMPLP